LNFSVCGVGTGLVPQLQASLTGNAAGARPKEYRRTDEKLAAVIEWLQKRKAEGRPFGSAGG